jgi:hypothetical protein
MSFQSLKDFSEIPNPAFFADEGPLCPSKLLKVFLKSRIRVLCG